MRNCNVFCLFTVCLAPIVGRLSDSQYAEIKRQRFTQRPFQCAVIRTRNSQRKIGKNRDLEKYVASIRIIMQNLHITKYSAPICLPKNDTTMIVDGKTYDWDQTYAPVASISDGVQYLRHLTHECKIFGRTRVSCTWFGAIWAQSLECKQKSICLLFRNLVKLTEWTSSWSRDEPSMWCYCHLGWYDPRWLQWVWTWTWRRSSMDA